MSTKIKLHYLFSKNKKIGSTIIRKATKHLEPDISEEEIPSHVAILINNRWVFESTLESGVRRISYEKWLEINTEIDKIECQTERTLEGVLGLFRGILDQDYDYLGVCYFGYRLALSILFDTEIPKINKWNQDNSYFCSEVVGKLLELDYQMIAPVQIMVEARRILR